ncbi:MAG: hypothetical protein AUH43_10350 [Acidobacteria bacterium 13_1_40CM_65_14]|nr:MAG: hypothetical protein AUH43_10350 [Acidobacteria bacterium 13_1_40CM_65_14]
MRQVARCVMPLVVLGLWTAPSAQTGEVTLIGASTNVAEPGQTVRIRILRWSSDAERTPLLNALNAPAAPTRPDGGERSGGAGPATADAGERGAGGGRAAAPARGAAGRGAGRGGRGGRGRGGAAAPADPIATLTASIARAPTVGYIWTNDVTGYAIKYAQRVPLPDGGERILLATDRRLGEHSAAWTPQVGPLTDYEFTLLEIRLDPKGIGEAKTSLTSKVVIDADAAALALDNYAAAPPILQKVKR